MTVAELPHETGFQYAFRRAFLAWQDTQPQMVLEGWADGLDEADRGKPVGLVEPVTPCGLTIGGGQRPESPLLADPSPLTSNGRCATHRREARSGRKEATP